MSTAPGVASEHMELLDLLALIDFGSHGIDLGVIDAAFAGFVLRAGQIWTPNAWPVRPGDLYAIPVNMQLIAELQRELDTPRQLLL